MLTTPTTRAAGKTLLFSACFVAVMLAIIFLEPFGPANVWIVLAISFGVSGWSLRNRLRGPDEVMSMATRTSFAIGAPAAIVLSILTVALASRIEPMRQFMLYSWPETTNDPRMVGFGLGVIFTTMTTTLCVCLARAAWWFAKR